MTRIAWFTLLLAVPLTAVAQPTNGQGAPAPVSPELAIVSDASYVIRAETNGGDGLLELRNTSNASVRVVLHATEFENEFGSRVPGKVLFGPPDELPTKRRYDAGALDPGKELIVGIALADMWPVGSSTAEIRSNGKAVGKIHAVKDRFAFNIAPLGWTETSPLPLRIHDGTSGEIVLQNRDGGPYGVRWSLSGPGLPEIADTIPVIAPNATSRITLSSAKTATWFSAADVFPAIFREPEMDAFLTLEAIPSNGASARNWPSRTYPVRLTRSFWSETSRSGLSALVLALLLAAGGFGSLLVTQYVPNRLRAMRIRSDIEALGRRIRRLPSTLRSSVRVGTRVEKQRLLGRVSEGFAISPEFAVMLNECNETVALVRREVDALETIGEMLTTIDTSRTFFAPTVLRDVCRYLGAAQDALDGAEVTAADITAAEAQIAQAKAAFEAAHTLSDDLRVRLAARVKELQKRWADRRTFAVAKYFDEAVPGVVGFATGDFVDPANIRQENYVALDAATRKLELILEVVSALPASQKPEEEPLLAQIASEINRDTYRSFRGAEALVRQLREGVRVAQLVAALQQRQARIVVNPPRPLVAEPATFAVIFDDPDLNDTAAQSELTCLWDFGDGYPVEDGWTLAHYYSAAALQRTSGAKAATPEVRFPVSVTFRDERGAVVATEGTTPVTLVREVTVDRVNRNEWGARTKVEILRLSIVLVLAILALLTGAKEQVAKLDLIPALIAVFVLGFTADQIKNVLAPRPN